jgi:cell wall-associated NlpC family hydrolase
MIGLVVALSSYLILNTVNPKLVSNNINIGVASFEVEEYPGDSDAYVPANYTQIQGTGVAGYNFDKAVFPSGVVCPKSGGKARISEIAASWQGKATYSQVKRGTPGPNGTQHLDCSSYVTTVLLCAGIQPATYATTKAMFEGKPGSEKFSKLDVREESGKIFIKNKELQPGDLLGWRNGDKGHVVIYVGGGKFRESQVGGYITKNPILGKTGNSVQGEKTFSYYKGKLEYLRRITP